MKHFTSYEYHSKCSKIKQQQNKTKVKKPASDKLLEVLAYACRKYGW